MARRLRSRNECEVSYRRESGPWESVPSIRFRWSLSNGQLKIPVSFKSLNWSQKVTQIVARAIAIVPSRAQRTRQQSGSTHGEQPRSQSFGAQRPRWRRDARHQRQFVTTWRLFQLGGFGGGGSFLTVVGAAGCVRVVVLLFAKSGIWGVRI